MLPVMEIILPHQGSSSVPAFLAKLWKMVDDPSTNELISWNDEGNSFIIHNQPDFTQHLLPYYYKHSNMASFVRQLNMYGFHKVVGIESGGLKSERHEEMEFAHPFFLRGQEHLLEQIKRKVSTAKGASFVPNMKSERVSEVLNEVTIIKDKQEDIDGKLETMKKENEALWREVVSLRQKHQAQQKIVNKLIQFLVSLVQPRMGNAVKRRYPQQLAIEDVYQHGGKEAKTNFGSGPVIKDVTHEKDLMFGTGDPVGGSSPKVEDPISPVNALLQSVDPSLVNPAIRSVHRPPSTMSAGATATSPAKPVTAAPATSTAPTASTETGTPKRPTLNREISKEDFDMEMNIMQKDLDNLKDILSGQITFDHNILSNLFNPEEPLSSIFPAGGGVNQELPRIAMDKSAAGLGGNVPNPSAGSSSAITFDETTPNLFELPDLDEALSPGSQNMGSTTMSPDANVNIVEHDDDFAASLNTPLVYQDQKQPAFPPVSE